MRESEGKEYMAAASREVFDIIRFHDLYCQADETELRVVSWTFRRYFLPVRNLEVLLKSMTIPSACNKSFRRKFFQPDNIGIIPVGVYTGKGKKSKKAIAWLMLVEKKGKRYLHLKKRTERQLPHIRVNGFCEEPRTVYSGCYWYGHTCMPFQASPTACGVETSPLDSIPYFAWNAKSWLHIALFE